MPSTRWDWIRNVQNGDESTARHALGLVCQGYWYPVYARLRSLGCRPDEAEDVTQGFFEKLIRTKVFESADPEKGRLRALLYTSLDRFLYSWRLAECAQKRGGGHRQELPLSAEWAEGRYERELIDENASPEEVFNRRWWGIVLSQAMQQTASIYAERGKSELFQALFPCVDTERVQNGVYDEISQRLNVSLVNLRAEMRRLKRQLAIQVEDVLRRTVGSGVELEEEMRIFVPSYKNIQ